TLLGNDVEEARPARRSFLTTITSNNMEPQELLDLLQKEVGMQSSSSSAVSSQSQPSMKSTGLCPDQPRHTENCKGIMFERQGPPGEASPSQQQKQHKDISTITIGSRRTQPDDSSEELHRELLSEVRRLNSLEVNKKPKGLTPTPQTFPPSHKRSQGKSSGKPLSAGSEWVHRERDLWSSQNQTGSDGSYLGFLPQSQSTPGIFFAPMKFNVKTKLGHLSAIESNKEVLYQSSMGAHSADGRLPDTANQCAEEAQQASDKVRSLPSLNYLQKVDAWRTKQSSDRAPLFEDLALDRPGVSPEKKGDEAGSNTLNQGLPQQALQQPSTNQDATQISSSAPSGATSPRRGEAVGGAPSALANKGSAAPPSASPFGRSQSLSSLSPVVMSADKHQQTNVGPENRTTQIQTDAHPPPSTAIQPSPLDSLGHFSDVSVDQELSSSQDSCTEIKVGPSVGTSSVVSLELDNYAPYWTFKHSTTSQSLPGSKELNIDERIPILNLRLKSPELFLVLSSVLSVDSSISIPFSLDSLGPAASMSEQVRARTSLPSNSEAAQKESRPVSCSQPDERSTILHPGQQQHDGRQDFIQIEDRFQPNWVAMKISGTERNLVLQSSHSLGQESENSFVSTRALSEIRKLLSQGENMISTGSSTASSGPNAASHFSDIDIFRPPTTKDSRLQSSSFSSFSSTGSDLKSQSSLPLARSSSESMLTSEKPKQSSAGQESLTSSWQPDNLSTQTVSIGPQDGAVSNSAGASLVMSKSARRAEPEGCSAAPPDKIPTQPSTAAVTQQLNATSTDGKGLPEEEEKATPRDPGAESRSSSPIPEDADQGVISGGSSESSLAVRVAKLLLNESPATMTSSTPSVTDQEEGKARGKRFTSCHLFWFRSKLKTLFVCVVLSCFQSQGSTDTESSAASSVCANKKNTPPKEAEAFSTLIDANKKLGLSMDHPDPQTQLQSILHLNLEARVCEIAAREGVKLPSKRPQTLTSIIIPTHSHSVTSSPSLSPAPPLSPASDPLHLTELPAGTVRHTSSNKSLPTNQEEAERVPSAHTTREPPSVYDESTSNHIATSQTAPGNQKRQDTVGGQSEEPPLDKQDVVVRHISTTFHNHHEEIYAQTSSFSAVGHEAKQAFRTTHLPHVHFTLPPKASDHTSSSAVHHPGVTLRDPSSAVSSPDEGVGSSSPAEWYDSRKPALDRSDASTVFKAPQGKGITASSQSFAQRHGSAASPTPFTAETPGTSPIQFLHYQPTELAHEKIHPAQEEGRERDLPLSSPQRSSNTLDHLWQKFYDQWSKEESRPASDKEASLLERLERLSHVIHHTQTAHGSDVQEGQGYYLSEQLGRRQRRKERWKVGGGREAEHPAQLRLQAEEPVFPAENDSIVSHSSSQNHPFSPADRDQPESLSTLSGSTSTVDTARLIRAFSANKVKHLNSSSSLSKLYSTINKQREVREHRRRTKLDSSVTLTPSETTGTDGSVRISPTFCSRPCCVVPDSASTSSTCTASPDRGPSRALTAKRAVRVVNKSIQAGELEIVHNGTRRHTRDVGTTFPSPGEARALEQISPPLSSTVGGRGGGWRVLPKSNNSHKQKKSKRSPPKPYPKGVSWFISADNLRSETRKENQPEESARRPNTAWFEPYSRVPPIAPVFADFKSPERLTHFFPTFYTIPAGGSGDAPARLYLSIQAEGEMSGSAGRGEEASGRVQEREKPAFQPAVGAREAAEACRYASPKRKRLLLHTVALSC
ncbi:hypothetical protein GOODEAATRI_008868, partial [Goodea atripinnis]